MGMMFTNGKGNEKDIHQCTMRTLFSISISQPNKLGPILKVAQCVII